MIFNHQSHETLHEGERNIKEVQRARPIDFIHVENKITCRRKNTHSTLHYAFCYIYIYIYTPLPFSHLHPPSSPSNRIRPSMMVFLGEGHDRLTAAAQGQI